MSMLATLLLAQTLTQSVQAPVLEFPEVGLDDPAAYEGYSTRFFRDASGNPFQIYVDTRSGRVVHVWGDASNASAAFTVRDGAGDPATVSWGGSGAVARLDAGVRTMRYRLSSELTALDVGWFLLGTMRQERDFQYGQWHRRPYRDDRFVLPELRELVDNVERLPAVERARHLELLGARTVADVRARLEPRIALATDGSSWLVRVAHTSLDGRNDMRVELRGDTGTTDVRLEGDVVRMLARDTRGVQFDVTVTTDANALTPLDRERIFNDAFDAYYAARRAAADSVRRALPANQAAEHASVLAFRRLEREVRALELLSFEQKMMASMPNYATYFGRDMMMTALMLEPISSVELQENVIASVLRKLAPTGDVSHEEALGGQAIRENAAEYNQLVRQWVEARVADSSVARQHLARAREMLRDLQAVRENYRMIDDDFQLPVLVGRYVARADVPANRKRAFLAEREAGDDASRLETLMRVAALVAERALPYVENPTATNLVPFEYRDDRGWLPGSWRDSRVGYGSGRYAMDVNVVWVPKALEAVERILQIADSLGLDARRAIARVAAPASPLRAFYEDRTALRAAISTWHGARRHFEVRLDTTRIRRALDTWLATLAASEREYWRQQLRDERAAARPLHFLALALDTLGQPISAPNTDPATDLFLTDYTAEILRGATQANAVLRMAEVIARPFPVGLLIEEVGPVVVNDVYAGPSVQRDFRDDLYHSPHVAWGREVNLLFLGLGRQIAAAYDASGRLRDERLRTYVAELRRILDATRRAVDASGLRHNELWSYRFDAGTLRAVRYGVSSDIQLWNITDLAVGFQLERLPPP